MICEHWCLGLIPTLWPTYPSITLQTGPKPGTPGFFISTARKLFTPTVISDYMLDMHEVRLKGVKIQGTAAATMGLLPIPQSKGKEN